MADIAQHYDTLYRTPDAFGHQTPLYETFITALAQKLHLTPRTRVLDVGCGQGILSRYLATHADVWCTDLSLTGLQAVRGFASHRIVGDALALPFGPVFDVVFQRSCSLMNTPDPIARHRAVTALGRCLKPNGVICLVYNSNQRGGGTIWQQHTLRTLAADFKDCASIEAFAVNKLDCRWLGARSFNQPLTEVNRWLGRWSGRSTELIVLARPRPRQ